MASSKKFKDFILEQLDLLQGITCKQMMGEYLLYYEGVIFGGIYDDRLLIKIVNFNKKYNLEKQIPYKNAKPMYVVDNLEDKEYLACLIKGTYEELKKPN